MTDLDEKQARGNDTHDEEKVRKDSGDHKSLDINRSTSEIALVDEEEEGKCGYGGCEPRFLQCCNNAKGFLVIYCFLVIVQGKIKNYNT